MFFFKVKKLNPQQINALSPNDKDDESLVTVQNTFSYYEKAIEQENYKLAHDHLKSIADDSIHYKGTRIRGKALFYIYQLAENELIDLTIPQGKTKHDVCSAMLNQAAAFGYEEAIQAQQADNPFKVTFD